MGTIVAVEGEHWRSGGGPERNEDIDVRELGKVHSSLCVLC